MQSCTHVFQISGIKIQDKKKRLIQGINRLGGKYIGGSVYQHASTHLIIPQVLSSEKCLAACAAGKWVVTPHYVLDSVRNGSWLPEAHYEVTLSTGSPYIYHPVREWREKVESGKLTGAFQSWKVLLMVQEPARRAMFHRLLKAGRAEVYDDPPPSHTGITHVMAKPVTENAKSFNAPCYPVSHIVEHLFGINCVNANLSIKEDPAEDIKASFIDENFSNLEEDLKTFINKREGRPRLCFLEFLDYCAPLRPPSEAIETGLSNVDSMIECGLFSEALDSISSAVFPGLLPPASYLISLMDYAQQGDATSLFLRNFHYILDNLIINNPPWLAPSLVKKYFTQLLQCPRCKMGPWHFLETAIRYSLSSEATCHPLPGPALPTLLEFHYDIVTLFLKIFQGEYHSLTVGLLGLTHRTAVCPASASGSLLYATFWTVWERSTLLSNAVKQLTQLLIEAAIRDFVQSDEKQKLPLADTLLDLLSVLVEFWCQQHFKLNQSLVEKGLKDLSEHLAVMSQDVSPVVLAEMVVRTRSTRLKLMMADAIFRNICFRNGITVGDEPLSFRKMVLSYLPLLGSLAGSPNGPRLRSGPTSHSCSSQGSGCRAGKSLGSETSAEKENIPRGLNRVNAAGETLLHRACKRNQVETVLQILTLPGTDVNVKDHAGWTPLHEACNHGSTECVAALLHHHPAPVLNSQVGGVSPLHDALLNRHLDIAKLLLEHAGSVLLQHIDEGGRRPLDLVSSPHEREQLLLSAQVGDSALRSKTMEVLNISLLEAGSTLLAHLIFAYHREKALPRFGQPNDKPPSIGCRLAQALGRHPARRVTEGWTEQRVVRLVEDAETLLELSQGKHQGKVAQAVMECRGENTAFLMEIVEDLRLRGEAIAASQQERQTENISLHRLWLNSNDLKIQ